MARRGLEDRNIRKLYRHPRGTVLVSLPKEIVSELKWRDGQKVVVHKRGSEIVIKDWKG